MHVLIVMAVLWIAIPWGIMQLLPFTRPLVIAFWTYCYIGFILMAGALASLCMFYAFGGDFSAHGPTPLEYKYLTSKAIENASMPISLVGIIMVVPPIDALLVLIKMLVVSKSIVIAVICAVCVYGSFHALKVGWYHLTRR